MNKDWKIKSNRMLIIAVSILCLTATACSSPGNHEETVRADTGSDSNNLKPETITDKNLTLDEQAVRVIDGKDMDRFWSDYLPDIDIQNEWVHTKQNGYDIAVMGALKENPKQGVVVLRAVSVDFTVNMNLKKQISAPYEGGSLSAISQKPEEIAKDYNIEIQEESGRVYLFNYDNGFTAYKDGANGDWKYWEE